MITNNKNVCPCHGDNRHSWAAFVEKQDKESLDPWGRPLFSNEQMDISNPMLKYDSKSAYFLDENNRKIRIKPLDFIGWMKKNNINGQLKTFFEQFIY